MSHIATFALVSALPFLILSSVTADAQQEPFFVDGFESGGLCSWSSELLTSCNVGDQLTIDLPGATTLTVSYVPAGTFLMGSPTTERGRIEGKEDLHPVTLTRGYFMGIHSVTQSQWSAITGSPMSTACGDSGIGPNIPVYCVSWDEVAGPGGFIDLLNAHLTATGQPEAGRFRLPTEAEFERAARAGTQTRFSHGDVLECDDYSSPCSAHDQHMWWGGNSTPPGNQPVGQKLANAFGLYDMHGLTFEWVQDWYQESLGHDHVIDPVGPAIGTAKAYHGGFWSFFSLACRSAYREGSAHDNHNNSRGFRLAVSED